MAKKNIDTKPIEVEKDETTKNIGNISDKDQLVSDYVFKRALEMQNYRKGLGLEERWREADIEYIPSDLLHNGGKRFEASDTLGLRSKLVPIGSSEDAWRSTNASPVLLVKIQTAFSVLIDRNPEAMFLALQKKYEDTTKLGNSLWKRSWEITSGKEVLKLFVFNMLKYGWGVGRTYPRLIQYEKNILTEYDTENPEKSKYEKRTNTVFNDLWRENLDPYRTWIDEMTRPYDQYSMNDCYYELDFSYDQAEVEFGRYPNWQYVNRNEDNRVEYSDKSNKDIDNSERKDIVTIGFYENKLKDIYALVIPQNKLLLFYSHLNNDDGMLSLWCAPWILRDAKTPYGISLWETIKQNKALYDKMQNMTMDQLVLSIMKMGFYTGTTAGVGDGVIKIAPGKLSQIVNGKVDWLEVPGPGQEAYEGRKLLKQEMDDDSGITPTLEGEITGKTLGEMLHAKEAALKRLKTPLENIANAIEQDAYLSLSWMNQIYSTPEVKEFTNPEELLKYEEETGVKNGGVDQKEDGKVQALYYPELSLHLEDRNGKLYESKNSQFFQVGKDIKIPQLKWKGMIQIIPKSILSPSVELEKQRKTELFNILVPVLQLPPELYRQAVIQVIKANEEEPEDWLPAQWLEEPQEPMFVGPQEPQIPENMRMNFADLPKEAQDVMLQQMLGGKAPQGQSGASQGPQGLPQQSMQAQMGVKPNQGGQTVVPQSQVGPQMQSPGVTTMPRQ